MKKLLLSIKRIIALLLIAGLMAGLVPVSVLEGGIVHAAETGSALELNNGYIKVTVSEQTAGFGIRTVAGDKVNKSDNDKYLVFEYDEDNTSFTSFQVTRNGQIKEYIFGGKYPGSSDISVTKSGDTLLATWSVDDLTFTQSINLVNTGSTEHGSALISYSVQNQGEPAQVKCRILMDTALGYWDYAYYKVGVEYLERETTLAQGGYDKSFYAVNSPENPSIVAYSINASVDDRECVPYQTTFAHWNNLASTVFDYTADDTMFFTNAINKKYMTSDSAYALYFDMGQVATGADATVATNYGVYSNESMEENDTMAVNVNAPDVIQFVEGSQSEYENGGNFTVKTHIRNISTEDYSDIRIVVTAAGCIEPLDQMGNPINSTIDSPYSMKLTDVEAGEQLDIDWNFKATPQEVGQYSRIQYKVYDVSDEATQGSGQILMENLLGEGYSYIMCPGSVSKMPELKFTGSSPNTIYTSGIRQFNVTGENFSMLLDKSSYQLKVSRVDGMKINGTESFVIPDTQFQVDDSSNVLSVILNDETPGTLPEGMYQLTLDYADAGKEDISGKALQFHVSADEKYQNETYGFLAVMKAGGTGSSRVYTIQKFATEDSYWDWLDSAGNERENVLLEFQGNFIAQKTDDGSVAFKGISNNKTHNVMTLNGSLDIRNGTCTVTEKDGSVTVDFDADLYTTGSGTYVHTGVAALTELEAGEEYDLIPYDENGERGDAAGETIALLWPSVGQAFQNLMGLLFNLRYGELGVIAHEDAPGARGSETRLVAFGAAMDLSFLIPESTDKQYILDRAGKTKDILGSSYDAAEHNSIQFSAAEIRALNKQADYRSMTANTSAEPGDIDTGRFADMTVDDTPGYNSASIVIDDILFGGEYLGLNMEVALGIPPYIMNMPALECVLSIHTVGDWSFGVDGQCHFGTFKLQAGLQILSHDGVPIVDSMSFFLGGFQPGFNIDGVGVLWLQGAQGGIENIYDTIFLTDKIPPLKLIIGAQFSIMQIFNAYATVGLSLRGVDVTLTNGQFTEKEDESTGQIIVPQPITMDGSVVLDWYPEFYFRASVNLALAMCIRGSGYIVGEENGFYEFFIRASVGIPSDVPIIGGYELAGLGMGVNAEKVFGKMNYLSIMDIGVTYYWGGDIDWDSGTEANPTYPELLGDNAGAAMMVMPVEYDAENDRTLYMALGSNMRMSASNGFAGRNSVRAINDILVTEAVGGANHQMQLGKNGSGKILSIQWNNEDGDSAKQEAAAVTIVANDGNGSIPIKIWDKGAAEGANANFSYDPETDTAYLSVAFAADDNVVYDKLWNITTVEGAQLVIYDVQPMPEVTIDSVDLQDNEITLELGGYEKERFTRLTVVAEGKENGQVYLLGGAEDPFANGESYLNLMLPQQAGSDTYTIRIVATDEDSTHYHETQAEVVYVNPNQPGAPTAVSLTNAGDYKVAVSASASGDYDGYHFTAYDSQGKVVSGLSNILMNKDGSVVSYDEDGYMQAAESDVAAETYVIGGRFEQTLLDEEGNEQPHITGFSAGDYTVDVRTWKKVAGGGAVLLSNSTTASIRVVEPVKAEIKLIASAANGVPGKKETITAGQDTYNLTTFASDTVIFQLSSETESFTGKWRVDGGFREEFRGQFTENTNSEVLIISGLEEGQHMLYFIGQDQSGDAVSVSYPFAVDTLGPRMLVEAPVNGSLFNYWTGELEIGGVTDRNVSLTVVDNTTGETVFAKSALQVDGEGQFTQTVVLDREIISHDLTILLTDELGNASEKNVSVMSNGLGSIEKLMLYNGEQDVTNTKMTAGGTYNLKLMAQLKTPDLAATGEDLVVLLNTDGMVDWTEETMEGEVELTLSGDGALLTTSSDGEGIVTARFLVSDEGAYSVSAAFGYTGQQIQSLDSEYTQIVTSDMLYTGEALETHLQVWYRGTLLVEGQDYIVGEYTNNVNVSTEDSKARVQIRGIGAYNGSATGEFTISYLELDENWITVSGQTGNNGYYISDVAMIPADGYVFVVDGEEAIQIDLKQDGDQAAAFCIRRVNDGAMTDVVSRTVSIDTAAPTGSIALDQTFWSRFWETISFGHVKVNNLAAEVTAQDNMAVDRIEYIVSDIVYNSSAELEAAGLTWKNYSDLLKPVVKENENQIIYVCITDKAGNVGYLCSNGIHVDTIAPTVSLDIASTTSASVTFHLTSDEAGTYYYLVQEATEEEPTAQQVKAGNTGTVTAERVGAPIEVMAGGLKQNTVYLIYAVAEDSVFMLSGGEAVPNTSEIAVSNPVVTDRMNLTDDTLQVGVSVENALYTGSEVQPDVIVTVNGSKLVENEDYELIYVNNVEVPEENSAEKPYVKVTGINDYAGILTAGFDISYLSIDESQIATDGVTGENGYYVSDVSVLPTEGYELVVDGSATRIQWTTDGEHSATFRVRRKSDGAMTDFITRTAFIDTTAPTGSIALDETVWSRFVETITFGFVKVNNLAASVNAEDVNGISKIEYVICESGYGSVEALEAAGLTWETYSQLHKPVIQENKNQIVYVRIADRAGNITYRSTDGIHVDTQAPEVTAVIDSVTTDGLTFHITSNEAGKYYYAVQRASAAAPTVQQVMEQTCANAVVGRGNIAVNQIGQPISLSASNLQSNTTYVVYVVVQDFVVLLDDGSAAPNVSALIGSTPMKTSQFIMDETNTGITVENAFYTGNEVEPDVEVIYDEKLLVEGKDYEVIYHANTDASTDEPYVEIRGMGAYSGTLTKHFTISYLSVEGNYTIAGTKGDNDYYTGPVVIRAENGYELVLENGSKQPLSDDGTYNNSFRIRRNSDGALSDIVNLTIKIDQTAPTGSVEVETNIWTELFNNITFGLLFKDSLEAKIVAEDACSGVASVEYLVSDQELDESELRNSTWTAYTKPVALNEDGAYVVYGKLTDNAGNVSYIGTDGLIIDTQAPGSVGIVDGGEYATEAAFTVDSDTVLVTVDGRVVYDETSVENKIVVSHAAAPRRIVITDRAGNETILTITVHPPRVVSFVAEGEVVDTIEVEHGTGLTEEQYPEIPVKSGYDQTAPEWNYDGGAITKNTTINAVYTINRYTVSFVAEGEVVDSIEVAHGTVVAEEQCPEIPAKSGYDQTAPEWNYDGSAITKNTTINAVYTINRYTVSFVAEAEVVDTLEVAHGTVLAQNQYPEIPAKSGYDQTTPKWSYDGSAITSDTTINAVYTINRYTVSFVADGEVVDTLEVEHGTVLTEEQYPEIPEKEGAELITAYWDYNGAGITADLEILAVYNEQEEDNKPSTDEGNQEENKKPSTDNGNREEVEKPSTDEGSRDEVEEPSADEGNQDEVEEPSTDEGVRDEVEEPSADEGNQDEVEEPSTDEDNQDEVEEPSADEDDRDEVEEPLTNESNRFVASVMSILVFASASILLVVPIRRHYKKKSNKK